MQTSLTPVLDGCRCWWCVNACSRILLDYHLTPASISHPSCRMPGGLMDLRMADVLAQGNLNLKHNMTGACLLASFVLFSVKN